MCTLILKKPLKSGLPLQIFGNRDERLDRPALGFETIIEDKTRVWAPRDLEKGGTWLGLNHHGIFAGLTNRYNPSGYPEADLDASRGELPRLALQAETVEDAIAAVSALTQTRRFPGFHLLVASYEESTTLVWDGTSLALKSVDDDLLVISERSFGLNVPAREVWLDKNLRRFTTPLSLEEVTSTLSYHQTNSIDALCVHLDGINYGTRSAVCINLQPSMADSRVWESITPPCRVSWREVPLNADS